MIYLSAFCGCCFYFDYHCNQVQNYVYDVLKKYIYVINKIILLLNRKMATNYVEQNKKTIRRYSEITADTNFTFKFDPFEDQKNHHTKRKISEDFKNDKKQSQTKSTIHKKNIEAKCNYKLSSEILSFQLEEQRNHQLKQIHSNLELNSYFNCLKKLFMVLYQTSHLIMENIFRMNKTILEHNNLKFMFILLDKEVNQEWNIYSISILQILARNISYLSKTSAQFQRRIEMVAIKVTLHNSKRPKIEKAFLNNKIQKYWKRLQQKYAEYEIFTYIQDQFEKAQQKLCFIQFQHFVKTRVCTQSFGNKLHKYGSLQQIDFDMNLNFSFQFLIMQQLCFNESDKIFQQNEVKQERSCEIM